MLSDKHDVAREPRVKKVSNLNLGENRSRSRKGKLLLRCF